ncbi:rhomboid family GlyGly-CTERM serine protease [Celerinatantimonas diazotrophica]|uniref:Rhomboid family GlyGly-CTERM serine protease n=1 Tax=Celerinatantimonas diazotrophica TaxID=412034 RepID=A0A4R1K482_9GAMM|nr:rhomboid family GlyGly-CTERM serine protease [Celerinatantimonas diazotrophica]CAG9297152.1 hypothetical protein CEDIAZO_02320 [Celerinatantimonas diazotrophica]
MVAIAALITQPWVNVLSWNKLAIEHGQWWRLATGVLVHANWLHCAINLIALAVITLLYAKLFSPWQWLTLIIALITISNTALLYFSHLSDYVGLSGLLHGLFVYALLKQFPRHKIESSLLLVATAIKLTLEYFHPAGLGDQKLLGMPVATAVHRTFVIVAIGLFILIKLAYAIKASFHRP